jgi:hypothetical protein
VKSDPPTPYPKTWLMGLFCAAVVVVAVLVTYPVAEMGFIDDFSYVKTAQVFARTSHLVYNGWATAMLGWTVPWGALFIKLFGFSFTVVRLSTLPVAAASVALFHASLKRFGLDAHDAVQGALILGLSPLFLPLSATYMTDIAGTFVILLTLYLCQRALGAQSDRATVLWLLCAALTNVVGGTARQIAWLGALVMVPSAAWLVRRRRGIKLEAVFLWLASLCAIVTCLRWFERQPYVLIERIVEGPVSTRLVAHMLMELLKAFLCLLLVLLPITIAWLSLRSKLSVSARVRIAAVLLLFATGSVVLGKQETLEHRVMPWLGHVIGTLSIFPSTGEMLGSRVTTITMPVRVFLSLVVLCAALFLLEHLLTRPWKTTKPADPSLRQALYLLGPFTLSYVALLMPRGMYSFIYDRYLLGLMPGAIAILLLVHQRWVAPRLPAVSTAVLVIFALYTVGATHDWFSLNRARVAAVQEVRATGVAATSIQGGFDYDGWTQIEASGYINDRRIRNPPDAYHLDLKIQRLPGRCRLDFAKYTPAIEPQYFVVFERMPCLASSRFDAVTYHTWLPPFRRTIYIEQAPDLSK